MKRGGEIRLFCVMEATRRISPRTATEGMGKLYGKESGGERPRRRLHRMAGGERQS